MNGVINDINVIKMRTPLKHKLYHKGYLSVLYTMNLIRIFMNG